jgi:hypothetical protein
MDTRGYTRFARILQLRIRFKSLKHVLQFGWTRVKMSTSQGPS